MESDGGGGDEGGGVGGVEGMGGWIFLGMLQENMGKFPRTPVVGRSIL